MAVLNASNAPEAEWEDARSGFGIGFEQAIADLPANADDPEQRKILDALPALVFLERGGRVIFANAEARLMMNGNEEPWTPKPIEEVLWGLFPGAAEPQTRLTGTLRGSPFHAAMRTRDGRLLPVEGTFCRANGARREAVIVAHPSGREKAPKTRLMEDVLASIPEAVAIEYGDHVLYTNPAFTRMFGYSAEEAAGGSLCDLIVPEARASEHAMLLKSVDERGGALMETVRAARSGELIEVGVQVSRLLVNGAAAGYVFSFRDSAGVPAGL